MKTFIADIIPKIQRFSQRLDDLTKLTNQHWVSLGDIDQTKRVFIFRANNQLLISDNGIVEKGTWEYLGNQSILLETKLESYLLKHGFFDENVIALKLDSTDKYAFFVNETKYHGELNNIHDVLNFLENRYLKSKEKGNGIGTKKSNHKINHPDYTIYNINETKSFFGNITRIHNIKFKDDITGEVYSDINEENPYFKVLKTGIISSEKNYYKDLDFCIKALYIFLKTGKVSEEGYICTYF